MVQQISTNTFGCAKWIVSSDATQGTHTTIASALTSSSSGDTIFIRPGSYTENLTLKTGVNIAAYECDGYTPNVTIIGTCTLTGAGTVTITGIRLQTNSAALLAVTGSAASIVNLWSCYLNCSNNSGITFSSSSSSARISINNCRGDLGTTGISLFSHSSAGTMELKYTIITNSGSSTTASTCSAGIIDMTYTSLNSPVTTSSTSAFTWDYVSIDCSGINTTAATLGGSGLHVARYSRFSSGSASAVSCGSATPVLEYCTIQSTNTNAVTGSGTISYSLLTFEASSSTVNTTTQTPKQIGPKLYATGGISFDSGTNLLSNYSEGTFTPTVVGATTAGTTTYTSQTGYYRRVGNLVQIQLVITTSAATGTGNIKFGGFPFTIKNQSSGDSYGTGMFFNLITFPASTTCLAMEGQSNTTNALIQALGSGAQGALQIANLAYNAQWSLIYEV